MTEKNVYLSVPFPSPEYASLALKVLSVDKEHKRSEIQKKIETDGDNVVVKFDGTDLKKLRVAVNGTLKNILLIAKTIEAYKN